MFAIIKDNAIQQMLQEGIEFEWDGVQYPNNWLNLSSPEDKSNLGIVDVVYGQRSSDIYYWVSPQAPIYNQSTNQVDILFTSTPKDISSTKLNCVSQVQYTAYTILSPSDWMVTRAVETETTLDPAWKTWRASVRINANGTITSINAAMDMPSIETVMSSIVWPNDPNWVPVVA